MRRGEKRWTGVALRGSMSTALAMGQRPCPSSDCGQRVIMAVYIRVSPARWERLRRFRAEGAITGKHSHIALFGLVRVFRSQLMPSSSQPPPLPIRLWVSIHLFAEFDLVEASTA